MMASSILEMSSQTRSASPRDMHACVIELGAAWLPAIAEGISSLGWRVSHLTDRSGVDADQDVLCGSFASRQSLQDAVDQSVAQNGVPDLIVLSIAPSEAIRIASLSDVGTEVWRDGVHNGLRVSLWLLQAWAGHLKPKGGAIVFVAPSLSLVGGPDLVPLTTLLEGQRGLMKSVARQWGASGVTLNWIAAAPRALSSHFDAACLAVKPDAVSVALGRPSDPASEIAPVLAFLGSVAGRAITGATIPLDGGEWMVP